STSRLPSVTAAIRSRQSEYSATSANPSRIRSRAEVSGSATAVSTAWSWCSRAQPRYFCPRLPAPRTASRTGPVAGASAELTVDPLDDLLRGLFRSGAVVEHLQHVPVEDALNVSGPDR